ncbi:DUF4838 domain-containing protein [uncultured Victivallis sp.]|uniref:DUF4838 domain-containing protein n=1 Tax=uncultured Victivallis sp. TaxID=354118 RepID=UPI002598BFB2|nr:DUF4838 domain-containing protein [uncultured Victivallis sp.]
MAQSLTIASDGRSNYGIVIPDDAAPVLKNAAGELAYHLALVTGANFPIYSASSRPHGSPAFVIEPDKAAIKPDTTEIFFKGSDIILTGRMPRGPLYAVYTFLEDYVGIRWWTPTESHIPAKQTLTVEKRDFKYAPQIVSRDDMYRGIVGAFAPRWKVNGHFAKIPPEWGGDMHLLGWCHTFNQFLPPEKYFKDHPEWYSEIGGKRMKGRYQLCLTNQEMTRKFIEVCLEKLRQNPHVGLISVSQNDWGGRCECAKCLAVEKREGAASGPVIRFVNKVAEEIGKLYPDILVETLAYSYTRQAPKVTRPRDNVVIRLCCIENNFSQPVTHHTNRKFAKDVEAWSAIAKNLYIWNYVANYGHYILPYPNWRGFTEDTAYYAKHNAVGMLQNGDWGSAIGDFVRARAYITAKLMWDPSLDPQKVKDEFFNGYYGAAGPHLQKYIDFLCKVVDQKQFVYSCYYGSLLAWLDPVSLNEAVKLYREAEKAVADDPVLAERVRRERLPLDAACLERLPEKAGWKRFCGIDILPDLGKTHAELIEEFSAVAAKHEPTGGQFSENGPPVTLLEKVMRGREQNPYRPFDGPPPAWCAALPLNRWDHFQPNRFNLPGPVAPGVRLNRFDHYAPNRFEIPKKEGEWVQFVTDPNSHSKTVLKIRFNHDKPSSRVAIPGYYGKKKWRFRIGLRYEGNRKKGDVLQIGFATDRADSRFIRKVRAEDIAGKSYHVVEMKPVVIGSTPDQYLWFAPLKQNGSENDAVYIDYVTMIRER